MKNFITYTMILTFGIFLTFNAVIAGERFKVFELAESGQMIEFPVTATPTPLELQDTEIAKGNLGDDGISVR